MQIHSYQLLDSSGVQVEIPRGVRVKMCACLVICLKYLLVFLSPSPRRHFWSFGRSGAGLGLQGWLWSIAFGVPGTGRHCWAGIEALGRLGLQARAVQCWGYRAGQGCTCPFLPPLMKYFEPTISSSLSQQAMLEVESQFRPCVPGESGQFFSIGR